MVHEYTFQAKKGYFGINLNRQGISLLLKRTLVEKCRGKWNLLIGKKGTKKGSKTHPTLSPSLPLSFRTF